MNVFEDAAMTLGVDVVEQIRAQARRDMREHPPSEAQLDEMARLLLLLCDSADRNLARRHAIPEAA